MSAKSQQMAVPYARFSPRPNATECESIEFQLERLRTWSASVGIPIACEYSDEDVSGKSQDGRPELEKAITHACRIHGILIVYSLSRLARNVKDAIEIVERLDRSGADIASLTERIDTSTPTGRFFFTVMAGLAQLEREQLAERTSDAMRRHQASGRRMGRLDRCPYGYEPAGEDGAMLVPVHQEQTAIEMMRAAKERGMSFRNIGEHLDRAGFRRRNGQTWRTAPGLIAKILRREASRS